MTARTIRYVTALTALAAGAFAVLAVTEGLPTPDPWALLAFIALIAVAERSEVMFTWDRTGAYFTLVEVGIAAGLLLLPVTHVAIAVVPALALARPATYKTPIKVVYNAATALLCTCIAAFISTHLPAFGPLVNGRAVLAVLLGMLVYGVLSLVVFGGLLWQLQDATTARSVAAQLPLHTASSAVTTSIGIVLATLWIEHPELVPFVLGPAAAAHGALRSSARATALLTAQRAEHDRLNRVVDGASDGIVLLDADGVVQVWNPAMSHITGIGSIEAVGQPVSSLLTDEVRLGEHKVRGRWTLDTAVATHPRREEDARVVDRDGHVRDVRESHAFTFDDRGRCTGAVVVVRDVSRQRELERLRSDFVARISHELRTPLTPIRGFASVLLRRGDLLRDDQREEALTRIVERADHLHGLVEDLLLVTRLEHDEIRGLIDPERVDIEPIVRAAVDELVMRNPGRTTTVAVASDVPIALADPARVRQVVTALLDNAGRYTPDDTPIEVEVDRQDDDVRIRIVDHGPGIPSDQRDAIFERFHRLEDPLTMRTGGVGIGLFLSRRLTEAMHGRLELQPTAMGTGATFTVHLPVATPSDVTRNTPRDTALPTPEWPTR